MTDELIVEHAIQKAIKNGFKSRLLDWYLGLVENTGHWQERWEIIFSHDFAKAFWGEEEIGYENCEEYPRNCHGGYEYHDSDEIPAWQYHLQNIVLEENPIKYLEKFI